MRAAGKRKSHDLGLQQRLIMHYSRVAGWLETKPWYRDNNVAGTVRSLFPANPSRVLELCCGTGLLLQTLSDFFPEAEFIGVDISPGMVERARERLAHHRNVLMLKQDWIYELAPEWEHAFDVIVVKNALHVLDNVVTKLKDLKLVCHDRTTLIIVETVSPNLDANRFIKRLFQFADPHHLKQTFFTERTLTSALKEAGWPMAQRMPIYVRQHIDTEDWLRQKCPDQTAVENARKLLSETRNLRVRKALDFDTDLGVPAHMLRLQFIAQHVLASAKINVHSEKAAPVQLQLL
jgi:ubiquinone/menaquinone biosynthesis C-methylase UbiE